MVARINTRSIEPNTILPEDVADGPYVNLGFKCGRYLAKNTVNAAAGWFVFDSERNTYNVASASVVPNDSGAESSSVYGDLDALGVKVRASGPTFNESTSLYIGHAWATTTGRYSLAR